jgi:hypothetical protein
MWEPRRLTTLWAFKACYRDRFFTLNYLFIYSYNGEVVFPVVEELAFEILLTWILRLCHSSGG